MKAGDVLENAVTDMRLTVIETAEETGGRSVTVEYELRPFTGRDYTPAHGHRVYVEYFDILAGRAAYVVGGVTGTAEAGQRVTVPANTVHIHPWNAGDETLRVRQTTEALTPDGRGLLNALTSAETLFALARRGKVNLNGQPNPLQAAVIFYDLLLPDSYAAGLPYGVQRVLFGLMAGVGKLLGYRSTYPDSAAAIAGVAP